jgi:hypothetical protein
VKIHVTSQENTFGIGSKVTVFKAGTQTVLGCDEVRTDFCYRSKRSPVLHFGLGAAQTVDVQVAARDGTSKRFRGLAADKSHTLKVTKP